MSDCTFCRILRDELASSLVLEEPLVAAFLDIGPINRGHTLVLPRRHVSSFIDLSSDEVAALALASQRVAAAVKGCLPDCKGITFSLADGEAAGQEVPHAHMHVIPRHAGDGFGWRRFGQSEERPVLDGVAARLKTWLRSDLHSG